MMMPRTQHSSPLLLVAAIVLASGAFGQSPVPLFDTPQSLDVGFNPSSVAVGDFNQDGHADLVTADFGGMTTTVLLGLGDGAFLPGVQYLVGDEPISVAVGDFDEDGTQDVVAAMNAELGVTVLLGVGDGTFGPGAKFAAICCPRMVVVADSTGDGHQDLLLATGAGNAVCVLRGLGDGSFTFKGKYDAGSFPWSVAVADMDLDGFLDAVTADKNSNADSVLKGNDHGSFIKLLSVPVGISPRTAIVADLNLDGQPDIATTAYNSNSIKVSLASGASWVPGESHTVPNPTGLAAADLDGDAVLDLVTQSNFQGTVSVLKGLGGAHFQVSAVYETGGMPEFVAVADLESNGVPDVLVVNDVGTVTTMLGKGDGTFPTGTIYDIPSFETLDAGDFDGNGIPDLVYTIAYGDPSAVVLLGQGGGVLASGGSFPISVAPTGSLVADLDQDGLLDLTLIHYGASFVEVLRGLGDGSFVDSGSYAMGAGPTAVAAGDLDGDGTLDLISANYGFQVAALTVLPGLGDGTFAAGFSLPAGEYATDVTVADFDGDGDTDVAVTATQPQLSILLQDSGGLLPADGYSGPAAYSIVSADFDEDGLADVALSSYPNVVFRSALGDGTFGPPVNSPYTVGRFAASDADGDGHLDLLGIYSTVVVVRGLGDGSFLPQEDYVAGNQLSSLAVADFDGNGRPDVACGSGNLIVLLNQLDLQSYPWVPLDSALAGSSGEPLLAGAGTLAPGSAGSLNLSKAASFATSVLFLSLTSTPTPFKCGTLVPVPPLASFASHAGPTGNIELEWLSWPAGLAGVDLYLQYAIVDPAAPCGVALSNALMATVP